MIVVYTVYTVVVKRLPTLVKNIYIMAVLSFQCFLQPLFLYDGMIGAHTSLSQKT